MSSPFKSILTNFIQSSSDLHFIPILANDSPAVTPVTCVLDASFNPPHLAHAKLITSALDHYARNHTQSSILLLLATNNVDKPGQDVSSLTQRLDMMQLLTQDIHESYPNVSISLGIIKHGRFVDKLHALCSHNNATTYSFLVGFDTLIRILDPKYYDRDVPLAQSLAPVMDSASFLVLTRRPDAISKTPTSMADDTGNQVQFVENLRQGLLPGLPMAWANKIDIIEATSDTDQVSSSVARKLASEGRLTTGSIVSNRMAHYIGEHQLYKLN
jgi:nicotinamide-nucleotide adenylyltransferase